MRDPRCSVPLTAGHDDEGCPCVDRRRRGAAPKGAVCPLCRNAPAPRLVRGRLAADRVRGRSFWRAGEKVPKCPAFYLVNRSHDVLFLACFPRIANGFRSDADLKAFFGTLLPFSFCDFRPAGCAENGTSLQEGKDRLARGGGRKAAGIAARGYPGLIVACVGSESRRPRRAPQLRRSARCPARVMWGRG